MKEKSKVIIGLSSVLVLLLLVPISLSVLTFALPSVYSSTFYGGMANKLALLKKKENRRIIVIGGSSVPFSIDSSLIKKELPDFDPVDFGLYASLGTTMMMDLAKEDIQKGDIVILSPEQSNQTLSMYFNVSEAWKALDSNLDYVFRLNNESKKKMMGASATYVGDKYRYLTSSLPTPSGIYSASSFNEYGDISAMREYNIMPAGVDNNSKIVFDKGVIEKDFISYMNDFYKTVWNKGASLYYRFSPMNIDAIKGEEGIDSYYDYLDSKLLFPIMGNPHNSVMEKEWFYDTNFHLNSFGAKKFTKALVQDIKLTLKDNSKTEIEDPVMPILPIPEIIEGDNSDSSCFTYYEQDGSYLINGLTMEGQKKERLVIPVSYNDKPVVSFPSSLFKGNKIIKEIVIQPNIRSMEDYSFASSSLERLILEIEDPSRLMVGSHLLDESNADIYVKKERYNDFLVSYFWAMYANRIKPLD